MELNDILSAYLSRKGLRAKDEKLVPWDVIMPTLIMDVCYTAYDEHIAPNKFIHAEKRYSNMLSKYIGIYFRDFWRIWNEDESAFIVELMDSFREYINTHVEIVSNAIWRKLDKFDGKERELISRIMLCNILSQAAGMIHKHIFSKKNDDIEKVSFYSYALMNAVGDKKLLPAQNIDLNTYEDVRNSVISLVGKIKEFKGLC